jgi:hypothetical protein
MKPHKHAELIKAWADGAEIEVFSLSTNEWVDAGNSPNWFTGANYRIKPEPKHDYYTKHIAYKARIYSVKLCFDGETGELKSAEVLK